MAFRQLARQTAIYGLSSVVGRLLNYLLVPFYTYVAFQDAAEYGVITELYAYAGFLLVLLTHGMETACFRFHRDGGGAKVFGTALRSVLIAVMALWIVAWLGMDLISSGLGYAATPEYLLFFAAIVGLDALAAIPFAALRAHNRPLRFAGLKLFNIGINIALNLFFLWFCPNYGLNEFGESKWWFYRPEFGVGYVFLSNLIASAATLLFLLPDLLKLDLRPQKGVLSKMLRYAMPLLVVGLAGMVNEMLDRAMLKHLLPGTAAENQYDLGIYGANYKLAALMTLFVQAYRYAAEPFFFGQMGKTTARTTYARALTLFFAVGCALLILVWGWLGLFRHFIGGNYHEGLHIVPIVLIANLFLGIYFNVSTWYKVSDQTKVGAWLGLLGAGITITGLLLLVPRLGYVGAAWATLLCYGGMTVASLITGQRRWPIPYQWGRLGGYGLLCAALLSGVLLVNSISDGFTWSDMVATPLALVVFAGVVAAKETGKASLRLRKPAKL